MYWKNKVTLQFYFFPTNEYQINGYIQKKIQRTLANRYFNKLSLGIKLIYVYDIKHQIQASALIYITDNLYVGQSHTKILLNVILNKSSNYYERSSEVVFMTVTTSRLYNVTSKQIIFNYIHICLLRPLWSTIDWDTNGSGVDNEPIRMEKLSKRSFLYNEKNK